jgi:hypothetical protein
MAIKSLYRDYFQKSRIFLYPVLDIKRGSSVTPIQTHVSWEGNFSKEDMKFICLYHLRNDNEFLRFEKQKLLGNKHFFDFKIVEETKGVYIFDFSSLEHDWNCFITGSYSKMSNNHKRKIKDFYKQNNSHYSYIESYLHPERYFGMYSEILGVNISLLKEVGELCDIPDFKQEHLTVSIKNLEIKN